MERLSPAGKAWGVLIGGVVAYDFLCPPEQTLSEGVDRAMETQSGKLAVLAAISMTALHLCNVLPERFDPIHQVVEVRRHKLKYVDNYWKKEWNNKSGN